MHLKRDNEWMMNLSSKYFEDIYCMFDQSQIKLLTSVCMNQLERQECFIGGFCFERSLKRTRKIPIRGISVVLKAIRKM